MVYRPLGALPSIRKGSLITASQIRGGTITAQEIILGGGSSGVLRSGDYVPDTSGWIIRGDGTAEFNDVTVRGDVESSNWDGASPADLSTVDTDATEGFYLDSSVGSAQFMGDVFVRGTVTFDSSLTTDGTITSGNDSVGRDSLVLSSGESISLEALRLVTDDNPEIEFVVSSTVQGGVKNTGLVAKSGSNSAPSYSFIGDSDTGFYLNAANEVTVTAGGQARFRTSANTNVALVLVTDGAEATPSILWSADSDTGIRRRGANNPALVSGGSDRMWWSNSGIWIRTLPTTGSGANTFLDSSGLIHKSTSALKYKTDLEDADYLADITLRPMKFYRDDDERYQYGFIADWLGDQDNLLGIYSDGEIENYDDRAVLAILAAKINRLESRIKELENA